MRRELENRAGPSASSHNSTQAPPPAIGHGPSNLFQSIMAGNTAQGGPVLAPPQEQPPHLQGPPPPTGPPQHPPFPGYGPPTNGVL